MKLHRNIGMTQKTAWFMRHRIRAAFDNRDNGDESDGHGFSGPVEADETCAGGREGNNHGDRQLEAERDGSRESAVVRIERRETNKVSAKAARDAKTKTLRGFVKHVTRREAVARADDNAAYVGMDRARETACHSFGKHVRKTIHIRLLKNSVQRASLRLNRSLAKDKVTHRLGDRSGSLLSDNPVLHVQGVFQQPDMNGAESCHAMPKGAHEQACHNFSRKRPRRYVDEFAERHNVRLPNAIDRTGNAVMGMIGKRLPCLRLIAGNGLPSGARS